jgi:glutaconate CoA-transferase subunit A
VVLPSWVVSAVAKVPGGCHPSYAQGYSTRDNRFYLEWDSISRDRALFGEWLERYVMATGGHDEYMALVGRSR